MGWVTYWCLCVIPSLSTFSTSRMMESLQEIQFQGANRCHCDTLRGFKSHRTGWLDGHCKWHIAICAWPTQINHEIRDSCFGLTRKKKLNSGSIQSMACPPFASCSPRTWRRGSRRTFGRGASCMRQGRGAPHLKHSSELGKLFVPQAPQRTWEIFRGQGHPGLKMGGTLW